MHKRLPEATVAGMLELRAAGKTLASIAGQFGVSRERVRQIIASSGAPLCPKCHRPSDRARSVKGRTPQCSTCYTAMMRERPSRQARRTGYHTSIYSHRRAWIVRLAKQGLTMAEIAERMGIKYQSLWVLVRRMRAQGKQIDIRRSPYFRDARGPEKSDA